MKFCSLKTEWKYTELPLWSEVNPHETDSNFQTAFQMYNVVSFSAS
jgi:hypothetical protein